MSNKLQPTPIHGDLTASGLRFGVVVSRFNNFITERLLSAALDALQPVLERGAAVLAPTTQEAACPHCGRVRGVVYDGASHRCYGCWRTFRPTAPAGVSA